ncbi:MAG TPA: MCE family protein, partial [Proteobacteria bacterium]|nr:MCE family protein [Pseudomonadota bacterium]
MAMKRKTFMELTVGSFVLVGLLAALVMVLTIANRQNVFVKRYRLFAIFETVGGLKVGAPVFLAGVEVGTVNSLSFT